jgi:hypothetical protein
MYSFGKSKSTERSIEEYKIVLNVYQIIKRTLWNRQIRKQYKTTIYKVYFKPISTYNNQTLAIAKGNKSKIQATNMKFLTSIMVRKILDRIRRRG